jgi:S-adenosylmethionine:tRNA ribosyltransferase-isomerase
MATPAFYPECGGISLGEIIRIVRVSDFDYHLPEELIAQEPPADRAGARMLHVVRNSESFSDGTFRDLPDFLRPGDLLIFNDTRVIPARLYGRRSGARTQPISPNNPAAKEYLTGKVELLLTRQLAPGEWRGLVRPGRKIGVGEQLTFGENELHAEVIERGDFGERTVRFDVTEPERLFALLERLGHVPLPPYIHREDRKDDRERYQTVFARERGSVAAPTAGLHFTPEILDAIAARRVETARVTLEVGLGTFAPLRHEVVEENRLHRERYTIPAETAEKIARARAEKRRVVAVGTTTVRTLEYAAMAQGEVKAGFGDADIFIYPGFQFRVVDALLTNFHLPQSSLLMLVSAFAGREFILRAYEHAVRQRYRFFSYGDCMFIE